MLKCLITRGGGRFKNTYELLTHWGRVTHICVGNLTIISPDNGLSPGRCQAIIRTNAWILLIGPWGTNFSEISIGIQIFSFKKMHLKVSSAKWRPFCLGLNVLNLRAFKFSPVDKIHIFQCMGKIFCVYPLKFHTKYLTHTFKDMIFMQHWNFKSSQI